MDSYEKSLQTLELPAVLALLAAQAVSETARTQAMALRPSGDRAVVATRLGETSAAASMMVVKGSPSFSGVKDVRAALQRADMGGALNTRELLDIAGVLQAARAVRGFFIDALNYLAVSNYLRTFDSAALREYVSAAPAAKRNYRLRMALGALTAFLPYRALYNLFDRAAQMKKNTGWITVPTGIRHYAGEAHRASAYFPPSEWKFEGEMVLLPGDAHEYLSQLYGPDYMTPPPEGRRERHYYVALDLGAYGNEADDEKR